MAEKKLTPLKLLGKKLYDQKRQEYIDARKANSNSARINQQFEVDGIKYLVNTKKGGDKITGYQIIFSDYSAAKEARRALQLKNKTLTVEDYIDVAKKHGFDEQQAKNVYAVNNKKTRDSYKNTSGKQVDHVNARGLPEGFHHWRNFINLDSPFNSSKGSKPISRESSLEMGIGQTKEELIMMDFLDVDRAPEDTILDSLDSQGLFSDAVKAKRLMAAGLSSSQVSAQLLTKRGLAQSLSLGGAVLPAAFGLASSTYEVKVRNEIAQETNNPIDHLQTAIAAASLAADGSTLTGIATVPGTIASTALDLVNGGIDAGRQLTRFLAAGIEEK
jgi:hypothetical protein